MGTTWRMHWGNFATSFFILVVGFWLPWLRHFLIRLRKFQWLAIRSNIRSNWGLSSPLSAGEYPGLLLGTSVYRDNDGACLPRTWHLVTGTGAAFPGFDERGRRGGNCCPPGRLCGGFILTPLFKKKGVKLFRVDILELFLAKIEEFASSWDLSPYGKSIFPPRSRRPTV